MTNTTATLAAALDTTPRTLRKFLRSPQSGIESVGKGSRYTLPSTKRDIAAITKKFNAWQEGVEAKKAAKKVDDAPAPAEAPEAPEAIDEVEALDFDDLECPLDA